MAHLEVCSSVPDADIRGDEPVRRVVRRRVPHGGAARIEEYIAAIREALEADSDVRYIYIGCDPLDKELMDHQTRRARDAANV